jgi:single-strand DNA-binding protein
LDSDGARGVHSAWDARPQYCAGRRRKGVAGNRNCAREPLAKGECRNGRERSVNKAILLGRLGGDAETRHTQNGTPVSRFSLAMNRQWTDSDQQVHEETEWIYIVLWNKENLAAYLTKGTKVYVEGRIQTRSYEDEGGVKRYVTEVVAQNIVLLGSNGNVNGNGPDRVKKSGDRPVRGKHAKGRPDQAPDPEEQGVDGDVPF